MNLVNCFFHSFMILEILRENDFFNFLMICFNKNWIWNIESHEHSKVFHSHDFLQIFREFNFMILKSVFSVNWFHRKLFMFSKFGENKQKKNYETNSIKNSNMNTCSSLEIPLENRLPRPNINCLIFSNR